MRKLALIFLLLCSTAWPAQQIQQASIDFLLSRPETLDVLLHAETFVFTSTTDNQVYTAIRYLAVQPNGGISRYCLFLPQGAAAFPVTSSRFHRYTFFQTNGLNMDTAMLDWCIK